jgi:hypothetical protein
MPNRFEAIWFMVRDEDQLAELARRAIENGQPVRVHGSEYHCCTR